MDNAGAGTAHRRAAPAALRLHFGNPRAHPPRSDARRDTRAADAGPDQALALDTVGDLPLRDGPVPDRSADLARDLALDLRTDPRPIGPAALGAAFAVARVPCGHDDGTATAEQIPIVDSDTVSFVDGAVTLAGAWADTLELGRQPPGGDRDLGHQQL